MILDENEERFIRLVNDLYKRATGHELADWEKRHILISYRLRKQYPLAKIIMTRNGPKIIDFNKEEPE
jgi:hypothetical protein